MRYTFYLAEWAAKKIRLHISLFKPKFKMNCRPIYCLLFTVLTYTVWEALVLCWLSCFFTFGVGFDYCWDWYTYLFYCFYFHHNYYHVRSQYFVPCTYGRNILRPKHISLLHQHKLIYHEFFKFSYRIAEKTILQVLPFLFYTIFA